MRKQKIEWVSINIPKTLKGRVRELIVKLGTPSVAEYVREAITYKMALDREMLDSEEKGFEM